ncbi:ABC-type phosphate transport system periplasmic component [Vibrio astriarenae]|nr:ABC-type phosphate transport system periplasmic component [Vibrio sp. C7]
MNNVCSNILSGCLILPSFVSAMESNTVLVEPELMPLISKAIEMYDYKMSIETHQNVQQAMLQGQARVAISSRKWTDEEVGHFYQKYSQIPVMLYFTADVAAIVSHPDNPVESISMSDLRTNIRLP